MARPFSIATINFSPNQLVWNLLYIQLWSKETYASMSIETNQNATTKSLEDFIFPYDNASHATNTQIAWWDYEVIIKE